MSTTESLSRNFLQAPPLQVAAACPTLHSGLEAMSQIRRGLAP